MLNNAVGQPLYPLLPKTGRGVSKASRRTSTRNRKFRTMTRSKIIYICTIFRGRLNRKCQFPESVVQKVQTHPSTMSSFIHVSALGWSSRRWRRRGPPADRAPHGTGSAAPRPASPSRRLHYTNYTASTKNNRGPSSGL